MKAVSLNQASRGTGPAVFKRGQSAKEVRKIDVFDIIENNFDRFDRDKNSRISWSEVQKSVADPSIKGKEAAALATLYRLMSDHAEFNDSKRVPSLRLDTLEELRENRHFEGENDFYASADEYYHKSLTKLAGASDKLFGGKLPNGKRIQQGAAPSCAFLSATAAQAIIDPSVVRKAISELDTGEVSVKFPGLSKPVVLPASTDSEIALFSGAGKNGTWINQLEKAWGSLQTKNSLAAFEHSSWPTKSIRAWSGGKSTSQKIPKDSPDEAQVLLEEMAKNLAKNYIVTTWTYFSDKKTDLTMVPGHAYSVLDVDASSQKVTLRNPWGHERFENKHGKPVDEKNDGIFELSYQDFTKNFQKVAMQISKPEARITRLEQKTDPAL